MRGSRFPGGKGSLRIFPSVKRPTRKLRRCVPEPLRSGWSRISKSFGRGSRAVEGGIDRRRSRGPPRDPETTFGLLAWEASGLCFGQQDLDILFRLARTFRSRWTTRSRMDDSAHQKIAWKTSAYILNRKSARNTNSRFVGKSAALRKVLDQIEIVAPTGSTVLLHGDGHRERTDCARSP